MSKRVSRTKGTGASECVLNYNPDLSSAERAALKRAEQMTRFRAYREVVLDDLRGIGIEEDDPLFVSLADHLNAMFYEIYRRTLNRSNLSAPEAGSPKHLQDGTVTEVVEVALAAFPDALIKHNETDFARTENLGETIRKLGLGYPVSGVPLYNILPHEESVE